MKRVNISLHCPLISEIPHNRTQLYSCDLNIIALLVFLCKWWTDTIIGKAFYAFNIRNILQCIIMEFYLKVYYFISIKAVLQVAVFVTNTIKYK